MKRFFMTGMKILGYCIAIAIILMALLVSISRLVTPVLDTHRAEIEQWASNLLHTPVQINHVRITWYHYQPEITFDHVTILNKDSQQPIFKIQQIRVYFSPISSLIHWQPILSAVLIKGTDVILEEQASGEVSVQGFATHQDFQGGLLPQTNTEDIVGWLSLQPHLMLEDVSVQYRLPKGEKAFVIQVNQFNLRNRYNTHAISGNVVLQQAIPTELNVAAQWEGDILHPEQVTGRIYLYLQGVSLAQWLNDRSYEGWQLKQGLASAKIWASWNRGAWEKIQSRFTLYAVQVHSQADNSTHVINRFSGNIGWMRQGNTQIFAGDDVLVDLPAKLWPTTHFYLSLTKSEQGEWSPRSLKINYMDLGDVQSFLLSTATFNTKNANLRDTLLQLHLDGNLSDVEINFPGDWKDWQQGYVKANFDELIFTPIQSYPGVSHVSGELEWDRKKGDLRLNSKNSSFFYPNIFTKPIDLQRVKGTLQVESKENGFELKNISLNVSNVDAWVNLKGGMLIGSAPVADLSMDFGLYHANRVSNYLPMKIFDADLVKWLNKAFLKGAMRSGKAILKGPLLDFPFEKNGMFLITGNIKDLDLNFDEDWPVLRHLNGVLTFQGRSMVAQINSGDVLGIPLTNVKGTIPYLGDDKPQILEVQGSTNADLSQGLRFIHQSPLQKNIGTALSGIELNGPMNLALSLTIPLSKPEDTKVDGHVAMNKATLQSALWKLRLDNLTGNFHFTDAGVDANNIQGTLLGEPITLAITPVTGPHPYLKAELTGKLSVTAIENWLGMSLADVATGATAFTAELDLSFDEPLKINLRSNLQGVALKLPAPYGKTAEESKDFQALIITQQPLAARFNYSGISTAIIFHKTLRGFEVLGGEVHLGTGEANWRTTPGWYVTGNFDQVDWKDIQSYWQTNAASTSKMPIQLSSLRGIDVQAKGFTFSGLHLSQPRVQVTAQNQIWNVVLNSDEVRGQLIIPMHITAGSTVRANLQKLYIKSSSNTSGTAINPKDLPSISLSCEDLRYDSSRLGSLVLETSPSASGLTIKKFNLTSDNMRLEAKGNWIGSTGKATSNLTGTLTSSNIKGLLSQWDFNSNNIFLSSGEVNFDFNWLDAPYNISMANISGNLSIKLDKGRILEGENSGAQGIGRVLSLFSLQTLPRRLSLDFSDVFQKGYSFDKMNGDFLLQRGNATTQNTVFEGPVARVRVTGRIGLKNKDYDLTLGITPYVTSSIPVAATLLTGQPVIGLAAWVVNSMVMGSGVSKVATYSYTVTGSWANPIWKSK